ncbi:NAD(P)-dependent oxidoreductase [Oleiagrimonas soli]|uniref:3-hydroxyisobutyrate dehydrogenase-like beta-hydroxyacid dehydrogenase n=1 Tax=Oleiagrimonas soli TaxID=1543381 RepID=A0A099CUQ0_9GAMM|nr:NAD(P)-dependent oxidoreductase [Oleiagrimonas soli]KGI77494.1 oxidoreductase [Oleiagrimonas soli]MBB6183047.1 3-hydroxyisobutyrate dehydrogenase-like beta-hydroxyacid dehydrogenase [Oleiagrimonas soli]
MHVGFIGLGSMGQGMAANLLAAGHDVTVWNRSPEPVKALQAQGARAAETPAEAASEGVVLSMLADDAAVRAVILDGGVLDALPKNGIHANHATISVRLARELTERHAKRKLHYIAAPVFGRPDMAAAGKLNVVCAGHAASLERLQPLFDAVGQRTWPLGDDPVRASVAKIAGNFMLASAIESMAEASALTRAHGVSASDFLEIMTQTLFAAPAYQGYGKLIAESRYEPAGFPVRLGFKDVGLALQAGDDARVPLPFAGVAREALLEALAGGDGERDWASLATIAARRAHLDERDAD